MVGLRQKNGAGLNLKVESCKYSWFFRKTYFFGKCPFSVWNVCGHYFGIVLGVCTVHMVIIIEQNGSISYDQFLWVVRNTHHKCFFKHWKSFALLFFFKRDTQKNIETKKLQKTSCWGYAKIPDCDVSRFLITFKQNSSLL